MLIIMSKSEIREYVLARLAACWPGGYPEECFSSHLRCMMHAAEVLKTTPVGEEVVFMGHCTSGPSFVWDGSAETARQIMEAAFRLGGFPASAAWLVRASDVAADIRD